MVFCCSRYIKQDGHGPAICPGEWGGWAKEGGKDADWQHAIASWFVENDITDSFYWCLNPNSGDTVSHHSRAAAAAAARALLTTAAAFYAALHADYGCGY